MIPRPSDADPGYPGVDPSTWGPWIEHSGGPRPPFVQHDGLGSGDPVVYVGVNGLRGIGRGYSPGWEDIRWFRLPVGHAHYLASPGVRVAPVKIRTARRGPFCVAKVHVSAVKTSTRRFREDRARVAGLPVDQCGRPAAWMVDGDPLCANHAGRRAIEILQAADG